MAPGDAADIAAGWPTDEAGTRFAASLLGVTKVSAPIVGGQTYAEAEGTASNG